MSTTLIAPLSKAEMQNSLLDISVKTIGLTLGNLAKRDKIKKLGTYKDAGYISI